MRGGPPYGGRNMGGGQGKVFDRYFIDRVFVSVITLIFKMISQRPDVTF